MTTATTTTNPQQEKKNSTMSNHSDHVSELGRQKGWIGGLGDRSWESKGPKWETGVERVRDQSERLEWESERPEWESELERDVQRWEREREAGVYCFNHRLIKIINFFLALMNSAHLFLEVHCSGGAKKKIDLAPLLEHFFVTGELKYTNIPI